jgi:hypothetical protein
MDDDAEQFRKLAMEMVLRKSRHRAQRLDRQLVFGVPVDMVEHTLHPGMIVSGCIFHGHVSLTGT